MINRCKLTKIFRNGNFGMGEEWVSAAQRRANQRGRLILLSEKEAPNILSLSEFLTKLTDAAQLLGCDALYTLTEEFQGEDYRGYVEAYQSFTYERQVPCTSEEAPWADRPDLGLYHLRSWMDKGLLELPEGSIVRNQLRLVEADKVKEIPKNLNAVNGLRFVVCGFEKYRPGSCSSSWRSKVRQGTWRSV